MPRYVLLILDDPKREWASPAEAGAAMAKMGRFAAELGQQGKLQGGNPLKSMAEAVRVRARDGQVHVTDGPFAETKEMVGGFFVIEAADRAEALRCRAALRDLSRSSTGRVLATVVRLVGDLGRAEEIVQEAWLRALEHWPRSGVPDSPRAWLLTTARHLAVDELRRRARAPAESFQEVEHSPRAPSEWEEDVALAPPVIRDDPLRLVFTCCHPLLPQEARVALTLRTLGGLTTKEIARAFLTAEPTVAQRIVRAKKTLRDRNVGYRVPTAWELPERLPAVLEVLYLVFNEGYAAGEGDEPARRELCEEAICLAALLAELLPEEPEAHGLLALLLLQASRLPARSDGQGGAVLLEAQDRSRWERAHRGRARAPRARR